MPHLDDGATRLRSGETVWQAERHVANVPTVRPHAGMVIPCDVAIVGAGITGAFVAERFTRAGRRVVVIDRRAPATGSTLASTAMLQWEIDAPLLELEDRLGFEAARAICAQNRAAVANIGVLARELGIGCGYRPKQSVYLAGDELDAAELRQECALRERVGAQSRFLGAAELDAMGYAASGGLLSQGAAAANPRTLALGLLWAAVKRGAMILSPARAVTYEHHADGVTVLLAEAAAVKAAHLVLANGYEIPEFVPATLHSITSSWAVATRPLEDGRGRLGELVWEASDPYLYFREGPEGCVIAGGEDEEVTDPDQRDGLTAEKARAILRKLGERRPELAGLEADYAWAGFFGETEDSLPLIGRVPGYPGACAAFGYGGNGITFSAIAAEMLLAELEGRSVPTAPFYALDRA